MRLEVCEGQKVYFQGRDRIGGEIIDVPDKEGRLLKAIGRAKEPTKKNPLRVADPKPVARAPEAEQASLLSEGDSTKARRRYRRTDMAAED